MTTLIRYPMTDPAQGNQSNPADRLTTLRQEMDHLWELTFPNRSAFSTSHSSVWTPLLDLYDAPDRFTVKMELPGLNRSDFNISHQEGVLTICGERKPDSKVEKHAQPYRTERFTGAFHRSIGLPVPIQIEKVRASYKDGVLTIHLPKSEEAKPHKIEVSDD